MLHVRSAQQTQSAFHERIWQLGTLSASKPRFINQARSGNALFKASWASRGMRFDEGLTILGEDTKFFSQIAQKGGRILQIPEVLITEVWESHKLTWAYSMKRNYLMGYYYTSIQYEVWGVAGACRQRSYRALEISKGFWVSFSGHYKKAILQGKVYF